MYDAAIKLVAESVSTDEYGDRSTAETVKTVFADLRSITQSEFYQAQATGLRPEIKFVLPDFLEYNDEKIIRYTPFGSDDELEYSVIRTYRNNNELEIVCHRGVEV